MKIKLFGTKIYISFLFAATLSLMLATDKTGLIIPTLFAVLIHETGHLLAMWAADCAPKEIRLIPASVQIVESFPKTNAAQVGIIICGPLCNAAVGAALFLNYRLGVDISLKFALLNIILAVFNLLPVSGLDGGRLIEMIIAKKKELYTAERTVKLLTIIFSAVIVLFGIGLLLNGRANISVFIVALYLAVCALIKR